MEEMKLQTLSGKESINLKLKFLYTSETLTFRLPFFTWNLITSRILSFSLQALSSQ
jgi:hypothetical protein